MRFLIYTYLNTLFLSVLFFSIISFFFLENFGLLNGWLAFLILFSIIVVNNRNFSIFNDKYSKKLIVSLLLPSILSIVVFFLTDLNINNFYKEKVYNYVGFNSACFNELDKYEDINEKHNIDYIGTTEIFIPKSGGDINFSNILKKNNDCKEYFITKEYAIIKGFKPYMVDVNFGEYFIYGGFTFLFEFTISYWFIFMSCIVTMMLDRKYDFYKRVLKFR